MSYLPLFQQPHFLVQPAMNRFPTLSPVLVQPMCTVVAPIATPAALVTTTVQPVVLQPLVPLQYPVLARAPTVVYPIVPPPVR